MEDAWALDSHTHIWLASHVMASPWRRANPGTYRLYGINPVLTVVKPVLQRKACFTSGYACFSS